MKLIKYEKYIKKKLLFCIVKRCLYIKEKHCAIVFE